MLLPVIRLQDIAGTTALSFYMEKCLLYPRDNTACKSYGKTGMKNRY